MRRITAITAEHVHRQLHGRTKGHAVVQPAEVRAADDGGEDGIVTVGDVTEQTDNAGDVMAVEDGLRGGLGPHGGRSGAGAASGGEPADGRTGGEDGSPPSGACACGAGGGDGAGERQGGECQRCGQGGGGGLGGSGRAVTL